MDKMGNNYGQLLDLNLKNKKSEIKNFSYSLAVTKFLIIKH